MPPRTDEKGAKGSQKRSTLKRVSAWYKKQLGQRGARTPATLDEAISLAREDVAGCPPKDHLLRAECLFELGNKLESRYEASKDLADLQEAVQAARDAAAATSEIGDRFLCGMALNSLGNKLASRYNELGREDDIEEAITLAQQAVQVASDVGDQSSRADWLENLADMFESRYKRKRELQDLKSSIAISREAMTITPDSHPRRTNRLNNFGLKLESLYEWTGETDVLEEAIKVAQKVVVATPEGHKNRSATLNNLSNRLRSRYERKGAVVDLEEAISLCRRAVAAAPDSSPRRAHYLDSLATKLGDRYSRNGVRADLDEAIHFQREAIAASQPEDPDRGVWLNGLGMHLRSRYQRTGVRADLEEAIQVSRDALATTPKSHPDYVYWLANIADTLQSRYERSKKMADLDEAISRAREAVASTPESHSNYAIWLNNLGNKLDERYEHTGELHDLEEAIRVSRQAVAAMPSDHPHRVACLNNLGAKIGLRYQRTGADSDREEAIEVIRQALAVAPDDHRIRISILYNLGVQLERRHEKTGALVDREDSATYLTQAWNTAHADPFRRIQAGALCLSVLCFQGKFDAAAQMGKGIIRLLPTVNLKLLGREDQQYVLSIFAGVAADLCAVLLELNQVEDALEYLETGRTVIIGMSLDNKITDGEQTPEQRIQSAAVLPEQMSLGKAMADFRQHAIGGNVVVVNITKLRSDAIIITPTVIVVIHLPKLSPDEVKVWLSKDWLGKRQERVAKNKEHLAYLKWLWDVCVKPVVDAVRDLQGLADSDAPVRVWWIGSGLANSLPFHAAGNHRPGSNDTALHKTISSYTPSIKALAHARRRGDSLEAPVHDSTLLTVSMPTTPAGENHRAPAALRGVTKETSIVLERAQGHLRTQAMKQPSVDDVLGQLQTCSVAHFACHGMMDHLDPSNSGLILQRLKRVRPDAGANEKGEKGDERGSGKENEEQARSGSNEVEQDRLTVGKISEVNLRHARLAYLSACSTAQNKAERLSDEVIHVASGFLVAGFPHVVGCLWQSNDRVCVEVADQFYSHLFEQGSSRWWEGDVAAALRMAVMKAREGDMGSPLYWAPFIHYGP